MWPYWRFVLITPDQKGQIPEAFKSIEGNLSFGDFLSAIQATVASKTEHPIRKYLEAGFSMQQGVREHADEALFALLGLRNREGHDLMAPSEAKAISIFRENQPDAKLATALQALEGLLNLPLFYIEDQEYANKLFKIRRLMVAF